jgi:hypothetical protein
MLAFFGRLLLLELLSVFELEVDAVLVPQDIVQDVLLQVLLDILNDLVLLILYHHPHLESEVDELEALLPHVDSDSGDSVLDVRSLAQNKVGHDLLPNLLHDIVVVEQLDFNTKLGPLGVGLVLPLRLDTILEHLDGADGVLVILAVFESTPEKR